MNVSVPRREQRDIELIDYLEVLWKWKWMIIGGTLAVILVAMVITASEPRAYEATATLLVTESKIPRPDGAEGPPRAKPVETFESVIRNQSLALEAIRHFGLDKPPESMTPERLLAKHLSIRVLTGTNLIRLTAVFPDAKLAADVANFMARQAVDLNAQLNQTDTVSTKEYIQRQRDEARRTMDNRQAALLDFKRSANLESLRMDQSILLDAKQAFARLHSDLSIKVKGLQADVSQLRQALVKQEQLLTVTKSIIDDPSMLAAARERGADLKGLSSVQLKSQEINRVYQDVQANLITTESALASAETQRQDVERKIKDNETRLISIERMIADADARLDELSGSYALTRAAYELYTRKFDEASLSIAARITDLKIVDMAMVPVTPRGRGYAERASIVGAAAVVTLIVVAFLVEYLRQASSRRGAREI